jgi:hypothetical protein
MSRDPFDALGKHGFTTLLPAGDYSRFTQEAADALVGTYTWFGGEEIGHPEKYRMEIVAAHIIEDGRFIEVTLRPPEDLQDS